VTQVPLDFDHKEDQASKILRYLQTGKRLTSLEALKMFGCMRLGGRAYDLKKQGHNIVSEMIRLSNGKRVAEYRLEDDQ